MLQAALPSSSSFPACLCCASSTRLTRHCITLQRICCLRPAMRRTYASLRRSSNFNLSLLQINSMTAKTSLQLKAEQPPKTPALCSLILPCTAHRARHVCCGYLDHPQAHVFRHIWKGAGKCQRRAFLLHLVPVFCTFAGFRVDACRRRRKELKRSHAITPQY